MYRTGFLFPANSCPFRRLVLLSVIFRICLAGIESQSFASEVLISHLTLFVIFKWGKTLLIWGQNKTQLSIPKLNSDRYTFDHSAPFSGSGCLNLVSQTLSMTYGQLWGGPTGVSSESFCSAVLSGKKEKGLLTSVVFLILVSFNLGLCLKSEKECLV